MLQLEHIFILWQRGFGRSILVKMDLKTYQKKATKTAVYPRVGENYIYPTLGLVGEAGEIANKIKKIERDQEGKISEEIRDALKVELGDILWYVAQLATELGIELDDIGKDNITKLASRKGRGTLHGSGDER